MIHKLTNFPYFQLLFFSIGLVAPVSYGDIPCTVPHSPGKQRKHAFRNQFSSLPGHKH